MLVQKFVAAKERDRGGFGSRGEHRIAAEDTEDLEDGVEVGKNIRLTAAEGGKPEGGERRLDVAEVVAAKREVVQQIAGAFAERVLDEFEIGGVIALDGEAVGADGLEPVEE